MASSPSSSYRPSHPHHPPLPSSPRFTPIQEMDKEGEVDDPEPKQEKDHPAPLPAKSPAPAAAKKDDRQLSVLFNKCRPSSRDKTTVVPVDNHYGSGLSPVNPKALLHSLLLTLTRKSPRPAPPPSSSAMAAAAAPPSAGPTDGGEWKLAAQELSRKLLHATRRRDEALLESSRLKHSVSELERKLDRLESYCLDLKSALDRAVSVTGPARPPLPTDPFIAAVADSRTAVRALTRALSVHVRPARVASLLKLPIQNTGVLLIYMESLLNRVFYGEFERLTEEESRVLDPAVRSEMNRAGYEAVRGLTWEEVLSKGTKHYSEGLSKFCDKKMSEVVGMMGWARAWPEGLLQAFFGAAKGAWVVYLLSRCVHPAVPILRAERGAEYDARYMEHVVVGERGRRGGNHTSPVSVRVMVAPGFYLYAGGYGVIKCKVVCGYSSGESESSKLKKSND